MLATAISLHWVAILLACLAMTSALIPATLAVAMYFMTQLITSWRLFTIVGDPNSWLRLDLIHRKPHWYAAFGSLAFGALGVVGAFLLWTLS